jgi:hypothetical protein
VSVNALFLYSLTHITAFQIVLPSLCFHLIVHPKQLVSEICQCVGAVPADPYQFSHVASTGKWGSSVHAETFNLITAMMKYDTDQYRLESMTKQDLLFANEYFDPDLFQLFQYKPLDIPTSADDTTKQGSYLQQMNMQQLMR